MTVKNPRLGLIEYRAPAATADLRRVAADMSLFWQQQGEREALLAVPLTAAGVALAWLNLAAAAPKLQPQESSSQAVMLTVVGPLALMGAGYAAWTGMRALPAFAGQGSRK